MALSTDIYGGIDGTGPTSNAQYAAEFKNSFVNRLYKNWHSPLKTYDRGPAWSGKTTAERSQSLARQISMNLKIFRYIKKPDPSVEPRIYLAGYSRGGAAVINTCHLLKNLGEKVHCLFLFDAVDRTITIDDDHTIVPSNVRFCFHALRSPSSASREVFENCGSGATGHRIGLGYKELTFKCTHGGMGGVGWTTAGADGFIREENLPDYSSGKYAVMKGLGMSGVADIYKVVTDSGLARTNVTLAMEKAGSASVWRWMTKNLQYARVQGQNKLDEQLAARRGLSAGNTLPH